MTSIGKKILSAFVEVGEAPRTVPEPGKGPVTATPAAAPRTSDTGKFKQYFDKLFSEANIPGPDYFEFSKMVEAMSGIPDEKARYTTAFAGLQVQGVDKEKLLSTAAEYLKLLEADAAHFSSTVDNTLQQKVYTRQQEIESSSKRVEQLSREIAELHERIATLQHELKEDEEKIHSSIGGYKVEMENLETKIRSEVEKIKQHIN